MYLPRTKYKVNSLRRLICLLTIQIAAFFESSNCWAHDSMGILVQEMTSATPEIQAALAATPSANEATRSVLNNLRLWTIPRKLTVCFVSGSNAVRKRVADSISKTWPTNQLTAGRLSFDPDNLSALKTCGDTPAEDIRIDFQANKGYWSYVGIESRNHLPSMNLQGFTDTYPDTKELDRLVGHEMGHALGLEHEHQSPVSPECGWNFTYISSHYVWESDAQMHANFDKLVDYIQHNVHAYIFSLYDQKSLMHYDFEPEAFLNGTKSLCFISRNFAPSNQDQNAIRTAYSQNLLHVQVLTRNAMPELTKAFPTKKYPQLNKLLQDKITIQQSQNKNVSTTHD